MSDYLTDSVHPYSNNDRARYQLRSATNTNYMYFVPHTRTKFGDRAFSVVGPVVWHILPSAVHQFVTRTVCILLNADSNRILAPVLVIDNIMPFRSGFAHKKSTKPPSIYYINVKKTVVYIRLNGDMQ